jgi:hypothetical protein
MDEKIEVEVDNAAELHAGGISLLKRAKVITARTGENARGMSEIGELLRDFAASGVLGPLLAARPGAKRAAVDVIAEHVDGSILSIYAMEGWSSPASTDVHWHNYWQTLLVVEGSWPDTVWRPVFDISDGIARGVAIDRRETIAKGELQTLGPYEPHGWLADETRHTPKATLLMWSGSAKGQPRIVVNPDSGRLCEEYDFLNPRSAAPKLASTVSWVRF